MFSEYLDKALCKANYERAEEDGSLIATIPGFPGVIGIGATIEECRTDLRGALEGWLILKLWDHDEDIPTLGKLSLIPRRVRTRGENAPTLPARSRKAS